MGWTNVNVISPADTGPLLFVVIEMRGCLQIRFGGPNNEAMSGHLLLWQGRHASSATVDQPTHRSRYIGS
jgi:hypothetical protein